jgi:hypothetical protein
MEYCRLKWGDLIGPARAASRIPAWSLVGCLGWYNQTKKKSRKITKKSTDSETQQTDQAGRAA